MVTREEMSVLRRTDPGRSDQVPLLWERSSVVIRATGPAIAGGGVRLLQNAQPGRRGHVQNMRPQAPTARTAIHSGHFCSAEAALTRAPYCGGSGVAHHVRCSRRGRFLFVASHHKPVRRAFRAFPRRKDTESGRARDDFNQIVEAAGECTAVYRPGRVVNPEAVRSFVEQASAIASTFGNARRFTRASFA
jgi:hypothetical protein